MHVPQATLATYFFASEADATMGLPPRSTGVALGSAEVTYTTLLMVVSLSF
jgi:hypothetical protein